MSATIGFDFGLARIGVAVGNLTSRHAEAVTVLKARNGQPDWNEVRKLVETWQPVKFVVGYPVHGDSSSLPTDPASAKLVKKLLGFSTSLQKRFGVPVELVDESYSSSEARHLRREQRQAGYPRTDKGEIDMIAAVVILRSWLAQAKPGK